MQEKKPCESTVQEIRRITESFEGLRTTVSRADAFCSAARDLYANTRWPGDADRTSVERIAVLMEAASATVQDAVIACDKFSADLTGSQLVPTWGDAP